MNSPPSRYDNIFSEQGEALPPGIDIDEVASKELSGAAPEYGMQAAQPEIISYVGRPGVEYLVTAEYDESGGTIYDGKAIADFVYDRLDSLFVSTSRVPEQPQLIKIQEVDRSGGADEVQGRRVGNGILGRVENGIFKVICFADATVEASGGSDDVPRCVKFEETYTIAQRCGLWLCNTYRGSVSTRLLFYSAPSTYVSEH